MQLVKTKNHLIYSANEGPPSHACLGVCRKVWWEGDLPDGIAVAAKPACPQCGGALTSDIPKGYYAVVTKNAGVLEKDGAKITNAGLNLGRKSDSQNGR